MTILQSVIVWRDHATDCRLDAEHGEVGARDDLSSDAFGPAQIGNVEVVPESSEYTREHLIVIAEVHVHRDFLNDWALPSPQLLPKCIPSIVNCTSCCGSLTGSRRKNT